MARKILFPEWRDENQQGRYPFADQATLTNGSLDIPPWLFVDGRLYPIGGGPQLFLSRVSKSGTTVTLAISSDAVTELAMVSYNTVDAPDNGEVALADIYGRPAGVLVSDKQNLEVFGAMAQGNYQFLAAQTEFAAAVAVPQPALGVRGVLSDDGELLAGDVWLIGEDGIVLREEDGAVRIDIVGDTYASRSQCEDEEPQEGDEDAPALLQPFCPILTINGFGPDDYGNFEMRLGSNESQTNILRIVPGPGVAAQFASPTASLRFLLLGERRFRGD
jgi:hypothetical protein